ncbi:hypothetical protein SAMN04515617_1069 [Collimonas sp. OK242]|nr:hypothetical protein SAMN04515617_1069 [Collimonas sp. OK242]
MIKLCADHHRIRANYIPPQGAEIAVLNWKMGLSISIDILLCFLYFNSSIGQLFLNYNRICLHYIQGELWLPMKLTWQQKA